MSTTFETRTLVSFRGGFVADWRVVEQLLSIEARGGQFAVKPDGGLQVRPAGLATPGELAFLRARRDEVRRILEYDADAHGRPQ